MDRAQNALDIPERVEYWLVNWARWCRKSPHKLGYPSKVCLIVSGGESQRTEDWEEETYEAIWKRNCAAMDALISDLPPAQCCAIRHVYAGDVYRFPRENVIELIQKAAERLLKGMNDRVII